MQLSITFRHFEATDSLKEYAREKVEKVNRYLDRPGEAHVVLWLERHLHCADVRLQSGVFLLRGKEKCEDMYASIDMAVDKIERQLKRYKDKLKHHHSRKFAHHQAGVLSHAKVRHEVLSYAQPAETSASVPEDTGPRVIRTNELLAKPMSVEEAVMQLDLMNSDFLVFTHATTHEVNVVYRRKDGHYGLIEARAAQAGGHQVPEQARIQVA